MRGLIFRTFQDFVESRFSSDLIDEALGLDSLVSSGGAYTSVGDYPSSEFIDILMHVSSRCGVPASALTLSFGEFLFERLLSQHQDLVAGFESCFDLLAGIETVIHRNVRKLYAHTELPTFVVLEHDGSRRLVLRYESSRPFADLALGLIRGALKYYGLDDAVDVDRKDLSADGRRAEFHLTRRGG